MKKPLSQSARVYAAEFEFGLGGWFTGTDDMQSWWEDMIRRRWWKARSDITEIAITYGANLSPGKEYAHARKAGTVGYMNFPRARLCEMYAVHEGAHLLAWPAGFEHGPAFVEPLLEFTDYVMPRGSRARLRKLLAAHEVRMK